MLVSGEIDAGDLGAAAQRLPRRQARHQAAHPDYRAQERAYFLTTGIFPIMHLVVLRRDA
jgi:4,5-dihydroxyphthalate decarboxylase